MKRIGLLTSGGDCSGLNAAIRAVVFSAIERGWEVFGIHDATNGLILRPLSYHKMSMKDFEFPFATLGGTMLGTTNQADAHKFLKQDGSIEILDDEQIVSRFKEGIQELGLEALVVIGGDGSMSIVSKYCQKAGVKMVGIPKTMDNDAPGTDLAIGFQTARQVVMEALDKLDTTAASHKRVMIAEVMGRGAGHLALQSAIAGFADIALIPEIPYTYEGILKKLPAVKAEGRNHALMVVAEGGFNVRGNILGHIQRSGTPCASDRVLASSFGVHAVELLAQGKTDRVVVHQNGHVTDLSLEEVLSIGNTPVDPNEELVHVAKNLGIYIGEI